MACCCGITVPCTSPTPSPLPPPPPLSVYGAPGEGLRRGPPSPRLPACFLDNEYPTEPPAAGGGEWAGEGAEAPPRWRGSSLGPYGGGVRGPCAQGTSERRFLGLSGNHAVVTGCVGRVEGDCVCHRSCYSVAHARPLFPPPVVPAVLFRRTLLTGGRLFVAALCRAVPRLAGDALCRPHGRAVRGGVGRCPGGHRRATPPSPFISRPPAPPPSTAYLASPPIVAIAAASAVT